MKRSVNAAMLLALIFLFNSCGKSTCLNPGLQVTFAGFDSIEVSRVLIAQYIDNGKFSTLVNVSVYDTAYTEVLQSNDTTYKPRIDTSGAAIAPGYDYIISIPGVASSFFADSLFKITKISYKQVKRKASGNGGCTNDVIYYLDTIPHQVTGGSYTERNLLPITIVLNK